MDGNTHKAASVRRSACDQCRAKRVRCIRPPKSTAPCARCAHISARCVTGASGHPGRPRRPCLAEGDNTTRTSATSPADVSSPGRHRAGTSQNSNSHFEHLAPAMAPKPAPEQAIAKSTVPSTADSLAYGPQPTFWEAPGDSSAFFGSLPIEQNLNAPGQDSAALVDHLNSPLQLQGLLGADDELDALIHMGQDTNAVLDLNVSPLFSLCGDHSPTSPPSPQRFSAASSLMRFREDMDRRITAIDAHFSDPFKVLQGCKREEEGCPEVENPAALLLSCSKELIDILQNVTIAEDMLSTEVVLLALPSYLAFMRLCDSLFHSFSKCLCHLPPDTFKSVKVKSVLRIGGISSLQDMPLKTYATGVLDAVQDQVQTLEHCMGIPPEYCLSGGAAVSHTAAAAPPGIFSRPDRAQLFYAAMAQEDVKSRRGTKMYVESIRASIQESLDALASS